MPVRFGAGDFDRDSDGFRRHGGGRAHGGEEFDEGRVRGQSPGGPDRKESDFQGMIHMGPELDPKSAVLSQLDDLLLQCGFCIGRI